MFIIGEVESELTSEIIKGLMCSDLFELEQLNIYIKSEGGLLSDCFALIDIFLYLKKKYNVKLKTFGMGEISSAGFFIFIVGDEKILFDNCRVFVHEHIVNGDESTYNDKLKDAIEEKELYNRYVKYTSKMLNITLTKAKELLKKNAFLTNKELKGIKIRRGVY